MCLDAFLPLTVNIGTTLLPLVAVPQPQPEKNSWEPKGSWLEFKHVNTYPIIVPTPTQPHPENNYYRFRPFELALFAYSIQPFVLLTHLLVLDNIPNKMNNVQTKVKTVHNSPLLKFKFVLLHVHETNYKMSMEDLPSKCSCQILGSRSSWETFDIDLANNSKGPLVL